MADFPAGTDELDRLVAAVLFPGFDGRTAPDWLRRRLDDGLGGVVLFARNVESVEQLRTLTDSIRAHRPDALSAIDEEGGDVTRLFAATGSPHPGALALGTADDVAVTRVVAADIGRHLRAAGVEWNLAPDADVNSNPDNPVIGVRSFGSDPAGVACHVAAYVSGLQDDAGVAACAKHFPGHGDTDVDSHLGAPRIDRDRAALDSVELPPFAAAVAAGTRTAMTGHLVVPALDPGLPATLSPVVIDGLLRRELGFDGVVVSDALEMAGVAQVFGIERSAVLALLAGVDALCLGGELADEDVVARAHGAIRAALLAGELPEERLRRAAARLADLAGWCRGRPSAPAGSALPGARVRRSGDVRLPAGRPYVVTLDPRPGIAAGPGPWGIDVPLAAARPGAEGVRLREGDTVVDAVDHAAGRPLVLVVRDPHRHPWERELATQLLAARPDAVVVDMGVPSAALAGRARGTIETFGASTAGAAAAVDALCTAPTDGVPG